MVETRRTGTAGVVVAGMADPAFATDKGGIILAWNEAAQGLLGYDEAEALGEACHLLLAGRDVFGNRYCSQHCPLLAMTRHNEAVGHFEISFRCSSGEMLRTGVSVVAVLNDGSGGRSMIHILHPALELAAFNEHAGDPSFVPHQFGRLTPREIEVLRMLTDGRSTEEMADALFICVATVRNHVQSILRKLEVHSRLEAVAALHHPRAI